MELSRPFIRLPFRFDANRLKQELAQFEPSTWMAHPNRLNGNSAIPLVSLNGEDNDDFAGAMQVTPHLQRCDYVSQVMASFGEVIARSRFMRLSAGAEVSEHVDFNYHWYNRVRIHIPITTYPDVIFHCGNEQIHMQAGDCWIFDSWRRHKVLNKSKYDRVHLVIDTCGSSRFWSMVRSMQDLADEQIIAQSQTVAFDPKSKPEIRTERFNVAPVMAPGELEAIAKELIKDYSKHPGNDPALVQHYTELLSDLAKDWRETWLLHGFESNAKPHYQDVLERTVRKLKPEPRALVTSSNNVGVNPIIMQRIVRAALNI